MTIIGRAQHNGVSAAVSPGGALRSLELEQVALQDGAANLSAIITAVVHAANTDAKRQADEAVRTELGDDTADGLSMLGLADDGAEDPR